jgi:ankyrin repeat protein
VEVRGNGEVEFEGVSNVLVTGHHRARLSPNAVQELMQAFERADYFSLKDQYTKSVTDAPTYVTSIEFDDQKKSVVDYLGLQVWMPEAVRDLEGAIDRIADTERWVRGTSRTGAALVADGWDFASRSQENFLLFAKVVEKGPAELTQLFLNHGAPAFSVTQNGESALASAARRGDLTLVRQMIASNSGATPTELSCALGAGVESGNLELARLLFAMGATPNGPVCAKRDKPTVLMRATVSGNLEIVKEVLKRHADIKATSASGLTTLGYFVAHAHSNVAAEAMISLLLKAGDDLNHRDNGGQTPLFYACENGRPEIAKILVAAGADLNVKDESSRTVVMSSFNQACVRLLIDSGADLDARDQSGRTAAEEAREIGDSEKADLIEAAVRGRKR